MDTLKLICAALAALVLGAVLLYGPDEIRDEVPHRQLFGAMSLALGGLMVLALFSVRAKGLLLFLVIGAIGAGFLVATGHQVHRAWALAERGRAARATVERRLLQRSGGKVLPFVQVTYDGHRGKVRGNGERGSKVQVVYLEDAPEIVARGGDGDRFLDFVDRGIGRWKAIGGLALGVLFALYSLVCLSAFLRGEDPGAIDPPEREDGVVEV